MFLEPGFGIWDLQERKQKHRPRAGSYVQNGKGSAMRCLFVVREPAAQSVALLVAGAGVDTLAMALGENLPP
jgi:hypothetical protein